MYIDTDNGGHRWDSHEWLERSSSDNHVRHAEDDWYCWNVAEGEMLFDWEFAENTVQRESERSWLKRSIRIEIHTLIDSPKVKSWITCFISPSCGWLAAECVETWKLPGTRLMLNEALIRHPAPLFSGIFWVLLIKPTSCRPRSSWISMPTTKPNKIKTSKSGCRLTLASDVQHTDIDVYWNTFSSTTFGSVDEQFTDSRERNAIGDDPSCSKTRNLHFGCDEIVEFNEQQCWNEWDTRKRYSSAGVGWLSEIFGNLPINVESTQRNSFNVSDKTQLHQQGSIAHESNADDRFKWALIFRTPKCR